MPELAGRNGGQLQFCEHPLHHFHKECAQAKTRVKAVNAAGRPANSGRRRSLVDQTEKPHCGPEQVLFNETPRFAGRMGCTPRRRANVRLPLDAELRDLAFKPDTDPASMVLDHTLCLQKDIL